MDEFTVNPPTGPAPDKVAEEFAAIISRLDLTAEITEDDLQEYWRLEADSELSCGPGDVIDDDADLAAETRGVLLAMSEERPLLAPETYASRLARARMVVKSGFPLHHASEYDREIARRDARRQADEDLAAEARARHEEDGAPALFADIAQVLETGGPITPQRTVGLRNDGERLFYPGQVNVLFGDPESGKTWLALYAVSEALQAGECAAMIDLDHNGLGAIIERLRLLGVPQEVLMDQSMFRLAEPEDAGHLTAIVVALVEWEPAVVVVDSMGELLPLLGLSSNSPDDFTTAHALALKPLARSGACVIVVDHLAKNSDSRAQGPTGTIAKKRAVGGVSLRVTAIDSFTPGQGGRARLTIHKDRHGGLRGVCPRTTGESLAATFVMSPEGMCALVAPDQHGGGTGSSGSDAATLHVLADRVSAIIEKLDELGVPNSEGRDRCRKKLVAACFPASNADIGQAVSVRKSRI